MESVVCKHFQTGFCKFEEHCRKQHIQDISPNCKCADKACTKRHPRICKFFNNHNTCKFGEHCAYQHKTTKENNDIMILAAKVDDLENTVKVMSANIDVLEERLQNKSKESISTSNIDCEQCNYHASSTTVLKRHMTIKHPSKHTPEVLREQDPDSVLHLNQLAGGRAEDKHPMHADVQIFEESNFECEYIKLDKRCDFKSNTLNELHLHITMKHTIDQSYVYPISTIEI